MKQRVRDLIEQGDKLFSKRSGLMSFWQDVAENFYPERADFTTTRTMGEDFAAHLMSGYPVLVRRDLANNLSSMLRPRGRLGRGCAPIARRSTRTGSRAPGSTGPRSAITG